MILDWQCAECGFLPSSAAIKSTLNTTDRAGQALVCHFVSQEQKPGKGSCSPYRRARLTRSALTK